MPYDRVHIEIHILGVKLNAVSEEYKRGAYAEIYIGGTIMRFYTFGNKENKKIMLIHGMGTTWNMSFSSLISILEKNYYVIAVSLDGYNPEESSIFDSFEKQAEKIVKYLSEECNGKIDIIYASSMGGAILILLSNKAIKAGTSIIDGLYADYFGGFAKTATKIMTSLTYKTMSGKSAFLMKAMGIDSQDELKKKMYIDAERETIFNCYYSTYTFKTPDCFTDRVHIWYGSKEKYPPKLASKIKKINKNVEIKEFNDCGHGSLLDQPEKLISEIERISE